jgi:CubicO group peptidase (beta-lactamase class C family)
MLAMALLSTLVFLLASSCALVVADICPIYGPVFPPAKSLPASPTWHDAASKIKTALDDAFASGNTSHGPVSSNDTYSIQIFSTQDILFEYYNEGANLAASGDYGTEVNGDSVYRIGSSSKLYAVYLLLVVAGDRVFSDPVVKYFPELKGVAHWDDVVVGALAGQVGGVDADGKFELHSMSYSKSDLKQYIVWTTSPAAAFAPNSQQHFQSSWKMRSHRA